MSADSQYVIHKGYAAMYLSMIGISGFSPLTTIIYLNEDDHENLADLIHEINELEISCFLLREFNINHNDYPIALAEVKWLPLLESRRGDLRKSYTFVSHLIAPYGYNCFIGRPDPELTW